MSAMKSCVYAISTDEGLIWCDECGRQCRSKCKRFVSYPKMIAGKQKANEKKIYEQKLKEWLRK